MNAATELSSPVRATYRIVSSLRAPATAKAVLLGLMQVRGGSIEATLPSGQRLLLGDADTASASLKVNDFRFARRVVFNGDIGFAEGLIAGEWESDHLPALLTLLADKIGRAHV